MAVAKWIEYKVIVTRDRVNKYTRVAWFSAIIKVVIVVFFMVAVRVPHEMIFVVHVDVILCIFWFVCISLTDNFYVKAYLAARNWNRTRIRPVNVLAKGKFESKVAHTTFWLTVFVGVSTLPISFVYLFQGTLSFFLQISTIRWAETMTSVKLSLQPTIVLV